jgi:hypothetical protein
VITIIQLNTVTIIAIITSLPICVIVAFNILADASTTTMAAAGR